MRTWKLAAVATMTIALVSTSVSAATVYRVLKKSKRAVFQLNDDELLKVNEGDTVSFKGSSGQAISGRVVKLMETRALVKVNKGFTSVKKDGNFTLVAQADTGYDGYDSDTGSMGGSSMSSGGGMSFQGGDGSPSPFADEYWLDNGTSGVSIVGKEEPGHIARVPRWQAGISYGHLISLDISIKNDDSDSEVEVESKGANDIDVYGITHLHPNFWLGGSIRQSESKAESTSKPSDSKSKTQNDIQKITLMGAFKVNPQFVLGLALDNVKDDYEVESGGAKVDETISYNRVRSSVAYYGSDYEAVLSHRATVSISEPPNSISEPALLKVEAEKYTSDVMSVRGSLAYVWYNRIDQDFKNTVVPTIGMVYRMSKNRIETELLYKDDHYRDDGESPASVRGMEIMLSYYHLFAPHMEGFGILDYQNISGGDDLDIEGTAMSAIIGFNYKG